MNAQWYRRWGIIYIPISWYGWTVTLLSLLFCIYIFLSVDQQSHSVSDTLYEVFPYIVPTFLLWFWLASKTSQKE